MNFDIQKRFRYDDRDTFSTIYKAGQWRVNSVSPMYNLQYNPVKMKQYIAKIKQALATDIAVNSKFIVNFETDAELRKSAEDPVALVKRFRYDDRDTFSTIYKAGQWRVNSVSPMYNLQYNPVKMKQYIAKIKQALATDIAVNSKFIVNFETDAELRKSAEDPVALVITISTSTVANDSVKCLYAGILMSWGIGLTVPNSTHLPYFLDRGDGRISNTVKKTLCGMFDCNIKQFTFIQQNLLMIGFQFVELLADCQKQIAFSYTRNSEVSNKVNINFDVEDISKIWASCVSNSNDINQEIFEAYQMLQNQVFLVYQIDIMALDLVEISVANKIKVKANGVISMKTAESVKHMFDILNVVSKIIKCNKD